MRRRHEALRRVFGRMVEDVIAVAQNRLDAAQPRSVEDIRDMGATVIRFSKPLYQELKAIRSFLFHRMYRAPSVMKERAKVTQVVNDLFPLFLAQPDLLPAEWQSDIAARAGRDRAGADRGRLRGGHDRPLRLAGTSTSLRLTPPRLTRPQPSGRGWGNRQDRK